jgi:hypothetical protein
MFDRFLPTIVIVADPQADIRGFSLLGKEFYLKQFDTRRDEALTMDGLKIEDEYYVVTSDEFLRVAPEAARLPSLTRTGEVYLPIYVAKRSFRPKFKQV